MSHRIPAGIFFLLAVLPLTLGYPVLTNVVLRYWRSNSAGYVIWLFGPASPDTLRHYGMAMLAVLVLMTVALTWFGLRLWFDRDVHSEP